MYSLEHCKQQQLELDLVQLTLQTGLVGRGDMKDELIGLAEKVSCTGSIRSKKIF